MTPATHTALLSAARHFLTWNLTRIERCVAVLGEDHLWTRPNDNSLSVGNQLLHLEGNIRQWLIAGLGGRPDRRTRATEFAAREGRSSPVLLDNLRATIAESLTVLDELTEADLLQERDVQAYRHDGIFILLHVTEHLSYHTGQIIFYTKAVLDIDLNFYGGDDLDKVT